MPLTPSSQVWMLPSSTLRETLNPPVPTILVWPTPPKKLSMKSLMNGRLSSLQILLILMFSTILKTLKLQTSVLLIILWSFSPPKLLSDTLVALVKWTKMITKVTNWCSSCWEKVLCKDVWVVVKFSSWFVLETNTLLKWITTCPTSTLMKCKKWVKVIPLF